MGCYSYICNKCGKNIREGEKVHLFHVRHGEILGEAEGTFNGYGSVEETEGFNNNIFDKHDVDDNDINCHDEVCNSKFNYDDSVIVNSERKYMKVYKNDIVTKNEYQLTRINELIEEDNEAFLKPDKIFEEFNQLPPAPFIEPKSGVVAYHKYCFDHTKKVDYTPSKPDPEQGWGPPRKKYL